jgi:hypothetical protein
MAEWILTHIQKNSPREFKIITRGRVLINI